MFAGKRGLAAVSGSARGCGGEPGAMVATPMGVYAGTLQHGLLCFDRARLRWRRITGGLPSANVTALAWANGTLYAGTDNGLAKIAEGVLQV